MSATDILLWLAVVWVAAFTVACVAMGVAVMWDRIDDARIGASIRRDEARAAAERAKPVVVVAKPRRYKIEFADGKRYRIYEDGEVSPAPIMDVGP